MAPPVPVARFKPRTLVYTPQFWRRMRLQPLHYVLYSTFLYDAAAMPREALFFQYGVGQTVATNQSTTTNATLLHTNLPGTGGVLPSPKLYVVTGMRIVPSALNVGFTDVLDDTAFATGTTAGITGQDSALIEDMARIVYGTCFIFFLGTRDDQVGPSVFFPGNTGLEGEFAESLMNGASPSGVNATRRSVHVAYNAGRSFTLDRWPTLIPPQQNFKATLLAPQATTPTIGTARAVWVALDGILGRETTPAGG